MMIKLTILSDNTPNPINKELRGEHGFSLYCEFDGINFLCDTGASNLFAVNADILGVKLKHLDFSFISHAHYDHTGGLKYILENSDAPVYLSDRTFKQRMFSKRDKSKHEIGIDRSIKNMFPERLKYVSHSEWISDNIAVVKNDCYNYDLPFSNIFLTIENNNTEIPDDFSHELSLALNTPNGLIIISPCSHNGAINIIDSCIKFTGRKNVRAFVGGLHFIDGPKASLESTRFLDNMHNHFPETTVFTGHCTGNEAKTELKKGKKIEFFYTGKEMVF